MNYFRASVLLSLLFVFVASGVQAIPQVTRSGRYLYTDAGTRFYIKGIAYQNQGTIIPSANNAFEEPSSFTDPLVVESACQRDLPFLQQLGVNVIRVYSVNSSLNHDSCMSLFSQAGIYTIIDLALPLNGSIDRLSPTWSTNLLDQYIATINTFEKYDNVLAYNVGNEVIIQNTTNVSPYVKAAARDTKAYLLSQNSSALVGYAAIDGTPDFIVPLAEFLSCDPSNANSGATSIDLYGLNNYEWCGNSTFEASGYAATTNEFSQYNVVAYFSEFGCITSPPRLWTEVVALFGSDMTPVFSGGLAFSYFPAESAQGQFGMVTISADGSTVTTSADFQRLVTEYNSVTDINSPAQSAAGPAAYPSCPATSTAFDSSTTLPPTPNDASCNCLENNLSCQFTPITSNFTAIVGALLDFGCSSLGQAGGSCNAIAGNGSTGVYGQISGCSPSVELSYVMSQFYEANNRNPQACSFGGNGTVNNLAPSGVSAAAAATSCFANAAAVFTPSAPATTGGSSSTSPSKAGSGSVGLVGSLDAIVGMSMVIIVGVMSAFWTLL